MALVRSVFEKILRIAGALLSAWGAAIAGGALGIFMGGMLGPLLASVNMGLMLDKMAEYFGLTPGMVWFIEFALNWLPFFGAAKAILGALTGWLAGMGVGAVVGVVVGVIAVLLSSVAAGQRAVAAPLATGLVGSRLDLFFRGALSAWLGNLALKSGVGLTLGVVIAEGIRYYSASLPFDHVGPEYMVSLVFGIFTVAVLGGTIGYSVASLCLGLQRYAPWALAGTAPGMMLGRALGITEPGALYGWALLGALAGHLACLAVGPLRGKLSLGREGALAGILVGWFLLDSPGFAFFSAVGCGLLGRALQPASSTAGLVASAPAPAAASIGFGFWPLVFNFRSIAGATVGFFVGGFVGHPGGLLLWFCFGAALAHFGAIRVRWAEAGIQAQAFASGGGGMVPAAVPFGSAGLGLANVPVAAMSGVGASGAFAGTTAGAGAGLTASAGTGAGTLFSALFGCCFLGLAGLSGFSALHASEGHPHLVERLGLDQNAEASSSFDSRTKAGVPTAWARSRPTSPSAPIRPVTPTPPVATSRPFATPVAPAADGTVLSLLHRYYADLNSGDFDANRYFESAVARYITMQNTSTSAMNHYIKNFFPKQFREHHFELVEGSLVATAPGEYRYTEASNYFQVGLKRYVAQECSVEIRLSPSGKLTFLRQFDKKPKELPPRLPASASTTAPSPKTAAPRAPQAAPTPQAPRPVAPAEPSPAPVAPPKPAVSPECAVPYRIDDAGIKRMKPECNR